MASQEPPPIGWRGYRWAGRQVHKQDDSEVLLCMTNGLHITNLYYLRNPSEVGVHINMLVPVSIPIAETHSPLYLLTLD